MQVSSVGWMRVRFTKVDGKRYLIAVDREHGPPLVERYGPGYDDLMPHDLAHYVVEEHFGVELGVWGQLAAGGGGIFYPAPEDDSLKNRRRVERIAATGREDMIRSENLVVLCMQAWERSIGRRRHQTRTVGIRLSDEELSRAVARLHAVAVRWKALPQGGHLTLEWPPHLTFDAAKSHRGRRRKRDRRPA